MAISPDRSGRRVRPLLTPTAWLWVLFAAFVLIVLLAPQIAQLLTDWLWFRELGFAAVFDTSLTWHVTLFVLGALAAYAFLAINIRIADAQQGSLPALLLQRLGLPPLDLTRLLQRVPVLLRLLALLVALVTGLWAASQWLTLLQALHAVPLGRTDPLFGRDIGFYLFQLPALAALLGVLLVLAVLALVAVVAIYGLRGLLPLRLAQSASNRRAELHIGALLATIALLVAVRLWLVQSTELLYSTTGPLVGASYTDVHVMLPAIRVSAAVAVMGALLIAYGVVRGRLLRWTGLAVAAFVAISVLGRGLLPAVIQRYDVAPNELVKETPYLSDHIAATRAAWGIEHVQTRALSGEAALTMTDIRRNAATIDNVRLWERDLLQQTLKQLQEIRTYYDFVSVYDDRYTIEGRYRQVHLSARELNSDSLPTRSFINDRLTFTHGMGLALAPVNQVTDEGLPVLFIKNLPPVSTVGFQLTRPEIYYGQLTNSYVFVHTAQKEFDYPSGEENIYTSYAGSGGVPVDSVWRRVLYAWQFGSSQILFSDDLTAGARIMYHRNIMDRAETALPFLKFDHEPYLVITDAGALVWVLDGYTMSNRYPYSQPVGNVNYARNSVKVTINAYDGAIAAYIMDPADPLVRTYAAIFPGIFRPLASMPPDVHRHLRYPGELFRIQALLQASFHMDEPDAFYHREDQWQIPAPSGQSGEAAAFMRHIILRLPGEQQEEFIYMTPFTPRGKDNLAAWMVARMDGAHYGQLMVYRFPKQSLVYGPKQIVNRINQDTDISRQVTLWDQRGSEVIRGELLVIPIEESLIYVQPLFLRASGGSIPELKRVIVASGNRVVMGTTLDEALDALFGGGPPVAASGQGAEPQIAASAAPMTTTVVPAGETATLARQAQEQYQRALEAQRAGNWAEYGRQIDALGSTLRELERRQQR